MRCLVLYAFGNLRDISSNFLIIVLFIYVIYVSRRYFRKETVDVFKEVFEKHKMPNSFKTVILESRTRTQTKELKRHATLKQVFGCDRPASAPPVPDTKDATSPDGGGTGTGTNGAKSETPASSPPQPSPPPPSSQKNSTNGTLKPWHKSFAKIKFLMGEEGVDSDKDSKDYEESVDSVDDFVVGREEDGKDVGEIELIETVVLKKKSRRKCRSSGFDYIRKKKKIKKEDDEDLNDEKEKKKVSSRGLFRFAPADESGTVIED